MTHGQTGQAALCNAAELRKTLIAVTENFPRRLR